ncbi:GNAT family N-acetyltransferase [Pseudonocardia sp. C8]|uniref:GNAT family N-acetyltransferase n=1 Tax=Pseudonocardia sp. C8 TaxID=2762759 RepID=UPI0016427B7D|nr:GNAT family N-acetyltransferase [Pseudonocardia sp. C8]
MIVRAATEDDADAMARVIAAVAEEGTIGAEAPVDVDARAQWYRDAFAKAGAGGLWVLEDDGEVVGTAGAQEMGVPGVLGLGMALLPRARGRGGGRALLDAIVEHARTGGMHKVELEVWTDNARAIALYARAGFQVEGVRRNHYRRRDGSLRSTLLMAYLIEERG